MTKFQTLFSESREKYSLDTVGDINPYLPEQSIPMKGRRVTLYRLHPDDKPACRYVQKCGQHGLYEVKEIDGKRWYWCGYCEPGRKL
jgi:hypothetical protein